MTSWNGISSQRLRPTLFLLPRLVGARTQRLHAHGSFRRTPTTSTSTRRCVTFENFHGSFANTAI